MKSLTPLTIYLRSSSQSLLLHSRTTIRPISHYHSISSPRNDHQLLKRNVKVFVWWDFENCGIPNGVDALEVTKNITAALRGNGIQGPVTITAFGDSRVLPILVQEKLSLTGVSFNHVPNGGKNTADRSLLADLVFWVSQNPPPAYMFLISSDQDFANILHRLRMNSYNVLLASMDPVSGVLASAASITWRWSQLVRGESLSGRHYNEFPDGPLGSWYSHNRKPLEDFIPDMGPPPCVQVEASRNCVLDSKIRKVPLATVNRIRRLLNFYPNGVDISEFRSEMLRRHVPLDKNLYGHKKFSLLLKSLPTVLKLQSTDGSRIIVHSIKQKIAEPVVQEKVAERDDQPKVTRTCSQPKDAKQSDCKLGECTESEVNSAYRSRIVTAESNDRKNVLTADVKEPSLPSYSPSKISPNKKNNSSPEMCSTTADSSLNSKAVSEEVIIINSEERDESTPKMSIFGVFTKWYISWKTSTKPNIPNGNLREGVSEMRSESDERRDSLHAEAANADTGKSQINIETDNSELFSDVAFWEGVLSFLHTPKGESLITRSKNRSQMVEKLQKEGPSLLNNLAKDDLSHLVDLLIYEKKWIEETVLNAFPFRLIHPVQTMSSPSNPHKASNLQRALNHEWENRKKKDTLSAVCSEVSQNRGNHKSKMLANCQRESKGKDHDLLDTVSRRSCLRSGNTRERNEGRVHVDYEDSIYLSEEDSDSDGESPIKDTSYGKRVTSDSDDPLLQMLDSYYGNNRPVYNSRIDLKPSLEFEGKRTLK